MTIVTPHAAFKNKQNFVIDENFSLVGYVVATKLNLCNILDGENREVNSLDLQRLRITLNENPVLVEEIILDVDNE